jgi:hypothetical protein
MDPALKDYLDSLKGDMAQLQRSVDTRLDAVMHKQDSLVQQITNQSDRLSDLCGWKPDLEARFADLQATVTDLKRAQPSLAAAASGSEIPGASTAPPSSTRVRSTGNSATATALLPEVLRRWPPCRRRYLRSWVQSLYNIL